MIRRLMLLLTILPVAAMAANQAPLGRLFLTPAERAGLDIVRQNNRPPEKIIIPGNPDENSAGSKPPAPVPVLTVHGYVKRTDGKGTVWINGQPVEEKAARKDIEIGRLQSSTNDVSIKLPASGQTVKLKAGQSYDPASGKVGSLRELAPVTETLPTAPETETPVTLPAGPQPSNDVAKKTTSTPVPAPAK